MPDFLKKLLSGLPFGTKDTPEKMAEPPVLAGPPVSSETTATENPSSVSPPPSALPDRQPHVAVAGGGIGGLITAYEFAKKGYDVTILEASPRFGGHIRTERGFDNGLYWNAAAELVSTGDTALIKVMDELGIGRIPTDKNLEGKNDMFFADGKAHNDEEFLEAYKPLARVIKKHQNRLRDDMGNMSAAAVELDHQSMDDFLKGCEAEAGSAPWVGKMLRQAYTGELGRDTHQLSALAFLELVGTDVDTRGLELFGDSDEAYRVEGGTESIITALQGKLQEMGVHIRNDTRVQRFDNAPEGISITSVHNDQVESQTFDHVASAMPLNALRHVEGLEALGLPEEQVRAIKETQYTTLTKAGVEISREAIDKLKAAGFNGSIITDGTAQTAWLSTEGQTTSGNGVMTFFNGGETGTTQPAELLNTCKKEIAAIIGMDVDKVFPSKSAAVAAYGSKGKGCYIAPAQGQLMPLMSFKQQQHPHFSMVGEFVPVPTERGHDMGCMVNAANSAQNEVARASALLEQRAQQHPVAETISEAPAKNWVQTISTPADVMRYPAVGAHTLAIQASGAAVMER